MSRNARLREKRRGLIANANAARVALLLLPLFALLLTQSTASAAEPTPGSPAAQELRSYAEATGTDVEVARENLALQAEEADVPQEVEAALGGAYAGVWFDPESGEFVVPVTSSPAKTAVDATLSIPEDSYRTAAVESTWEQLEEAQRTFMDEALPLVPPASVMSSLNPETNSLKVSLASELDDATREQVKRLLEKVPVNTELAEVPGSKMKAVNLDIGPGGCERIERYCKPPIKGGTGWGSPVGSGMTFNRCTVGFPVVGNVYGNRFMLTAGHCVDPKTPNQAAWSMVPYPAKIESKEIGPGAGYNNGGADGDWALYNDSGSFWDQGTSQPMIVAWEENESYPIYSEGSSYLGQPMCHSGITTGTHCSVVEATDISVESEDGHGNFTYYEGMSLFGPTCAEHGDSGGPVFSGHTAFGIVSAATLEEGLCNRYVYYTEITWIAEQAGVHVGPRVGQKPAVHIRHGDLGRDESPKFNGSTTILQGQADPNGIETTYQFEYGFGGYGAATPATSVGSGFQPVHVEQAIPGLQGSTLYHYRLQASNPAGAVYTEDFQFTTPAFPPAVSNVHAEPGKLAMTLRATVEPLSNATTYHFEYGPTASYGSVSPVPDGNLLGGNQPENVAVVVNEIEGTYHYRICATNVGGTTCSADQEVYVQERPFITPEPATTHVGTKAELNAAVDPRGVATTYYFEYGKTLAYGTKTAEQSAGASKGSPVKVSASLSGLEFGSNYHFRLIATNWAGTRVGADRQFTAGWGSYQFDNAVPSAGVGSTYDSVSCISAGACVAVGDEIKAPGDPIGLVGVSSYWDGNTWEAQRTPPIAGVKQAYLKSVSCAPGGPDCWAVGFNLTEENGLSTLAERWNAGEWKVEPTPNPSALSWLEEVSCGSSAYCVGVGYSTGGAPLRRLAIAEVWKGSKWEALSLPMPSGVTSSGWAGVSCSSATSCFALGGWAKESPEESGVVLDRWNGSSWSSVTPPPILTGAYEGSTAFTCTSSTSCEVVFTGAKTSGGPKEIAAEHWNGSTWQAQTILPPAGANLNKTLLVTGLSCPTAASCELVGEYAETGPQYPPARAFAERLSGGTWQQQFPSIPPNRFAENLRGISCPSETACAAIGNYTEEGPEGGNRGLADLYMKAAPPGATTKAASALAEEGATLNATVNPNGSETKYRFEYGTSASYGSSTAEVVAGSGTSPQSVSKAVTGLAPGTTYHFRVVATSAVGKSYGRDLTFQTPTLLGQELDAMATTDTLRTAYGTKAVEWPGVNWTNPSLNKGTFTAAFGWKANTPVGGTSTAAIKYPQTVTDLGTGIASFATTRSYLQPGEWNAVWIDTPPTATQKTGYQVVLEPASGENNYKFQLNKWSSGSQVVLAEQVVNFPKVEEAIAVVDQGSTVSAWVRPYGESFRRVVAASDSTFSSGTTVIEGKGQFLGLYNLTFGALQPKAANMSAALGDLRLDDQLGTAESPLSEAGAWAQLAWDKGTTGHSTGAVYSTEGVGWGPFDQFDTLNGAYWTKATFADTGSGDAIATTATSGPVLAEGRHFDLWLNMPNPAAVRSGYELRFAEKTKGTYELMLARYIEGTQKVLATKSGVTLAAGDKVALTDKAGTLAAWSSSGGGAFTQLTTIADSTFTSGYAGLAGSGNRTRLSAFRAGPLEPF